MSTFFATALVDEEIATLKGNTSLYFSFDDDNLSGSNPLDLTPNNNDGTNNGATTSQTGIINESFYYGGNDYITTSYNPQDDNIMAWAWYKSGVSSNNYQRIITTNNGLSNNGGFYFSVFSNLGGGNADKFFCGIYTTSDTESNYISSITATDDAWHFIAIKIAPTWYSCYIDGVEVANVTASIKVNTETFTIGSTTDQDSNSYVLGDIDEVGISKNLGNDYLDFLYNSGAPTRADQQYPYTNPIVGNFTITLKDDYNSNTLTNFTAYVGNDVFNDSGTGLITTDILITNTSLFNVTIEKQNYFNSTYENVNVSSNLFSRVNGTNITFRIVFNNTNITANISNAVLRDLNNTLIFNSSTGYFNIQPTALENLYFNISCNRSVFETRTFNITFPVRDTNEYIIYVDSTANRLRFFDGGSSLPIPNANVNVTYPISGTVLELTTDVNGSVFFSYIYNNVTEFGNYTFKFNKIGYNLITVQENINSSTIPVDNNYTINRATLFINVYNRENLSLLTGINVTLNLLGVFQNETNNGTFTYQDISLISQDYTLQALADGYTTEQVTFTFNNQDNLTVNIYLLQQNQTNSGTLFLTVIDEYYFRQIGATVTLMEYSASENGFITVSECLTNTNGECAFDIELNTKTYIFSASKVIDGNLFSASSGSVGEIIKTDQEVRQLILRTSEDFDSTTIDNLIFNVTQTFINNISSITVSFNTVDNTATTVCVEYLEISGFTKTSVQTDCTTSSGAIANLGASYSLNRSNQYEAKVYNLVGTTEYLLAKYNYPSLNSASEIFGDEGLNPYLILAGFVAILVLALYLKSISLFFMLCLFLSWVFYGIFPEDLLVEYVVGINIISLFGLYISRKKQQDG